MRKRGNATPYLPCQTPYEDARAQRTFGLRQGKGDQAIDSFNPGVKAVRGVEQPIHYVEADDYTAGELNRPLAAIPAGRWLGGSQWHALTFVGSDWAKRNTRYTDAQWSQWVRAVADKGGVVTLDMGPNWDPNDSAQRGHSTFVNIGQHSHWKRRYIMKK